MQRNLIFCFCCAVFFSLKNGCNAQDDGSTLYSRRYERLDVDTILNTPRLVTNYVECLLNKKPCPPEGKALKRVLPEALRTKCSRCWPSQKEGALKVITKLYYDYPQHYDALREKWDPTGEYHRRFMEYLRDQKFNVINSNGEDFESGQRIDASAAATTTGRPIASSTTRTRPQTPIITRVPTGSQAIPQDVSEFIGNRFADDVAEFVDDTPMRAQSPRTPAPTLSPITPTTVRTTVRKTVRTTTTQRMEIQTPTNFQTQNPVLDIFNRLSLKFTNTAEFIASVIRGKMEFTRHSGNILRSSISQLWCRKLLRQKCNQGL